MVGNFRPPFDCFSDAATSARRHPRRYKSNKTFKASDTLAHTLQRMLRKLELDLGTRPMLRFL